MRELGNLKLYENNNLVFTLNKISGSDVEITNSGKLIFYDHSKHFKGKLKIHFYTKEGEFLFNEEFESADRFELSPSGEIMGVQSSKGITVISLDTRESYLIDKGMQFSIADKNNIVAVASEGNVKIYSNSD